METELKEEEKKLQIEAEDQLAELEKEMEEEKKKNLSSMSEDEISGFMEEIQRREDAKRAVCCFFSNFVTFTTFPIYL